MQTYVNADEFMLDKANWQVTGSDQEADILTFGPEICRLKSVGWSNSSLDSQRLTMNPFLKLLYAVFLLTRKLKGLKIKYNLTICNQ